MRTRRNRWCCGGARRSARCGGQTSRPRRRHGGWHTAPLRWATRPAPFWRASSASSPRKTSPRKSGPPPLTRPRSSRSAPASTENGFRMGVRSPLKRLMGGTCLWAWDSFGCCLRLGPDLCYAWRVGCALRFVFWLRAVYKHWWPGQELCLMDLLTG